MKKILYLKLHWVLAAVVLLSAVSCERSGTVTEEIVDVESVVLHQHSLELVVQEKQRIMNNVLPENASNKKLIWSIDDEKVASVGNYGHVTGVAPGKTKVNVVTEDGGKSAACEVTVYSSREVYISGYTETPEEEKEQKAYAFLWINGKAQKLPSDSYFSKAFDVVATDADVYVVGDIYKSGIIKDLNASAVMWKNGTMVLLAEKGYARSVFASGDDVYVSGSINDDQACIWKNGEANIIARGSVNSVFVCGDDVYAGGEESIYNADQKYTGRIGRIWKNGIPLPLEDGENSYVEKIFISGDDVYASGYRIKPNGSEEPRWWKNGEVQYLEGEFVSERTSDLYVNGEDVYVCGSSLWKNGRKEYYNDPYMPKTCSSVFVSGNNLYFTGESSYTELWINNIKSDPAIDKINLSKTTGIFVIYR